MLESLYTGNEETYHKKKQIIATEKTKQVSQPKIQSKPALPTIRVAVKQLDRLSHTIGALLISENQQNLQSETLYRLTQNTLKEFFMSQQQLNKIRDWSDTHFLLSNSKINKVSKKKMTKSPIEYPHH